MKSIGYETKAQCADMILADAITDLSAQTGRSTSEIRNAIVESPAYEALYDFETNLWQEGPDYFTWFYGEMVEQ